MTDTMRAVAVRPGVADSLHVRSIPRPSADDVVGGRGVLVRVLRVGLCGTDREIVAAEFGEALGARVEVLLPVGVGIVTLGSGCVAGPNVTGISALRARVECTLGNMPARSNRELFVVTTTPPNGVARGFAVVAMSDTPDPKPANNFLERVIPPDN